MAAHADNQDDERLWLSLAETWLRLVRQVSEVDFRPALH
jgi:hypothetical protein